MTMNQRYTKAEPASWSGIWGNAALALLKGAAGWLSGSKALLADGCRSAAEAAAIFAEKVVSQRSGSGGEAPYGSAAAIKHKETRKTETVMNVVLSAALLLIGLEIGISAVRDIAEGISKPPHWSALAVLVGGLLVKELIWKQREHGSSLYATLAVFIGAGAAWLGKLISLPVLYYFDSAAAIVISVIVINGGYRIIVPSPRKEEASAEVYNENTEELMQLVQRVEGVVTVQSLHAREQGHYVVAEAVISVNPRVTVLEGHEVAKRVKRLLLTRFTHLTDATIHVEPYDPGYPYKSNHDPNQEHMPTLLQ
ncbi:cation diffusion facilitator family transporter [Paenibacillus algorifonticola]|uniref:Cation diffusion facilitator family transporter n=1 Tax=Paenibacillus algorifonticola TaxID=684063 RepID=A0A1I2AY66_9BACL|nr:cation diffusion facilitator family transporter [Paenibacillus algorifonticola]SFE48766.1 cation diffusion facilitator family transporter [Paenibacillus algorifonticola]